MSSNLHRALQLADHASSLPGPWRVVAVSRRRFPVWRRWPWLLLTVLASITVGVASVAASCGDGVTDGGEQCDDGAANGTASSCCDSSCMFKGFLTPCTDTTPDDCFQAVCNGSGTCDQKGPGEPSIKPCTPASPLPACVLARCASDSTCGTQAPAGTACTLATPNECEVAQCTPGGTCGVPKPILTACTDTTPGDCLRAVCDGSGTCDQNGPGQSTGTPCTDTTPGDCFRAVCNGSGMCDQAGAALFLGTPCTDTTPGDCRAARCDGTGTCNQTAANQASGTPCTDTTPGNCFAAQCDGSGVCSQTNAPQAPGFACGDQTGTECNQPDSCDGTGQCQPNFVAKGVACTRTTLGCFVAQCDGSGACDQTAALGPCPAPAMSSRGLLTTVGVLSLVGVLGLWRRRVLERMP
jgi:hypothetical protein